MSRFQGSREYRHDTPARIGVIVTNLGTPDAPSTRAVRRYLAEFLSDPRVVEIPRVLWLCILHGIILRVRPRKSANTYRNIWQAEGSPLLVIAQKQTVAIEQAIRARLTDPQYARSPEVKVVLGMRYGNPSIADALDTLRQAQCETILVLPLYPHYSGSTGGSTFDAVAKTLMSWRWVPELHFINHYHDNADFIAACVQHIHRYWESHTPPDRLIFSYHGLPKHFLDSGDPYHCHCHKTTRLIGERLNFPQEKLITTFQSRFGKAEWLQPYTDQTLMRLGQEGVERIHVFCPGFSADCLETLEEIAQENRAYFLKSKLKSELKNELKSELENELESSLESGGKSFHYIPALNDSPEHIEALVKLIFTHLQPWLAQPARDSAASAERAHQLGAKV